MYSGRMLTLVEASEVLPRFAPSKNSLKSPSWVAENEVALYSQLFPQWLGSLCSPRRGV